MKIFRIPKRIQYLLLLTIIITTGIGVIFEIFIKKSEVFRNECVQLSIEPSLILKEEKLPGSNNSLVLYKAHETDFVIPIYKAVIIDLSNCVLYYLTQDDTVDYLGQGYQWLRIGDFNLDGKTEIAYLGWNSGTGHYNDFLLFREKNGDFEKIIYWNDGENSVEFRDLNGDDKEEIIHYYRIIGYKPHLYWREAYEWNEAKKEYEMRNNLDPNFLYSDLVNEYIEFINVAKGSKDKEFKALLEPAKCLKNKAELNLQGENLSGEECKLLIK